jgi:hypothetical protein
MRGGFTLHFNIVEPKLENRLHSRTLILTYNIVCLKILRREWRLIGELDSESIRPEEWEQGLL